MKIKIFATGGTFDKEYDEIHGQLFFKDSHVPEILKLGRSKLDIDFSTLMMIDSLDMTEEDRQLILKNCRETPEEKIVIVHGTDTMVETAKVLAAGIKGKTIVLTGAMIPYKFDSHDGLFNLGAALAFAQSKPAGVYITMNGKCFNWDNVRKNRDIGQFEELH